MIKKKIKIKIEICNKIMDQEYSLKFNKIKIQKTQKSKKVLKKKIKKKKIKINYILKMKCL